MDGGGEHRRRLVAVLVRVPEAVEGAGLVVVVPEQGVPAPALLHADRPLPQQALELRQVEVLERPLLAVLVVDFEVVEVEHHRQLVVGGVGVADARLDGGRGHLADGDGVGVLPEGLLGEPLQVGVDIGAVGVHRAVVGALGGVEQRLRLSDEVDDVEAEAPHSLGAPEVHDFGGLLADIGVVPVEVRLRPVEEVQVVLAGVPEGLPGGAPELGHPVGGQRAVGLGVAQVVVALVALVAGQRLAEPLVLGGGVVEDHVEHDADPVGAQGLDELLEVLHRPHGGVDGAVVGDVVAVVPPRRGEERVEPDVVHAQRGDVGDLLDDAPQVPDAVAVRVVERLGVDLVDD